ncbi:hypothetical protein IscW_ISCW001769 [Ixodes scapularis]|uniref:Uncharacterized protein n=1 Tax=Ixodes scapularis TaxID=6945 RepID=B7P5M9_IXOSC|nr:hypothetical protein IscW_ISCW001769 [Ixodes scapularis]|eukprot:XP_002407747.1 hypothetical protein IscW_ISCW001769 [Ixodes scapularis]
MGLRLFFCLHVVAFFVVFVKVLLVRALFVFRAVFRVDILRGAAGDVGRRGRGVERVVGVVSLAVDPGALQRSRVSAVAPQLEVVFLSIREQFLFVAESLVHVAAEIWTFLMLPARYDRELTLASCVFVRPWKANLLKVGRVALSAQTKSRKVKEFQRRTLITDGSRNTRHCEPQASYHRYTVSEIVTPASKNAKERIAEQKAQR